MLNRLFDCRFASVCGIYHAAKLRRMDHVEHFHICSPVQQRQDLFLPADHSRALLERIVQELYIADGKCQSRPPATKIPTPSRVWTCFLRCSTLVSIDCRAVWAPLNVAVLLEWAQSVWLPFGSPTSQKQAPFVSAILGGWDSRRGGNASTADDPHDLLPALLTPTVFLQII